jgi:DNA-binding NtrC family response regulator
MLKPETPPLKLSQVTLEEIERLAIFAHIRRHGGNKSHAAKTLGIARRTLTNKLNKYAKQTQG